MGDGRNEVAELQARYDDAVRKAGELDSRCNELLRRCHELETTVGQQLRMIDYYKNRMSVAEANLEASLGRRELVKNPWPKT